MTPFNVLMIFYHIFGVIFKGDIAQTFPRGPVGKMPTERKNSALSCRKTAGKSAVDRLKNQKVSRIWYQTTPPWVELEMPSLTKPKLA